MVSDPGSPPPKGWHLKDCSFYFQEAMKSRGISTIISARFILHPSKILCKKKKSCQAFSAIKQLIIERHTAFIQSKIFKDSFPNKCAKFHFNSLIRREENIAISYLMRLFAWPMSIIDRPSM